MKKATDLEKFEELRDILDTTLEKINNHLEQKGYMASLPEDTNLTIGIGKETFVFGLNADLYSEVSRLVKNMIEMESDLKKK